MNHSTPGLPVHHQLPEFHAHRVGVAIQPSHPLSPPSPPAPNPPPASGSLPVSQLFSWGGWNIGVSASALILPMNTQDWSPLGWTGWISLQYFIWGHQESDMTGWQHNHTSYIDQERKRDSKRLYHFLRNFNCSTQRSLSNWGLQHGGDEILFCAQIFVFHLFTLELPWICLRILPFK